MWVENRSTTENWDESQLLNSEQWIIQRIITSMKDVDTRVKPYMGNTLTLSVTQRYTYLVCCVQVLCFYDLFFS